jgi:uncharacterized membrane protein YbhN (UPF0104 family)
MKNLTVWLTVLGLAAVGLYFLGADLPLFDWADSWGETAGRGIRAGLAASGVAVFVFAAVRQRPEPAEPRSPAATPSRRSSFSVNAANEVPASARVRDRWPKLARRSLHSHSSTATPAPARISRPGY